MPITHTNAKGQTFALYQGTTKTGKPKYYFAMQSEGTLAKMIPAGYEIYENPNAQVFLRRIPPKIIADAERQVVAEGMRTSATIKDYKIDIKRVFPAHYGKRRTISEGYWNFALFCSHYKFSL